MKKKFLLFLTSTLLLNTQVALADCLPLYRNRIKNLEGKMSGFRTTIVTNLAAEGALIGGLVAVTGSVAVGGVLMLPATTVAASSYLGVLATKKSNLVKVMKLIKDAQRGEGGRLEKFYRKFERENGSFASMAEVAKLIVEGNEKMEFCQVDEFTEQLTLLTSKKIRRLVETKI